MYYVRMLLRVGALKLAVSEDSIEAVSLAAEAELRSNESSLA